MRTAATGELGYGEQGDEGSVEIARAIAEVSAPQALAHTSRVLVVEPRSTYIARSLRGAGFAGELIALASVHIGERYGVAGGYTRVIVDDWIMRASSHALNGARTPFAASESNFLDTALGMFQSIVITDLTRYLPADGVPDAIRWLTERLAVQGCLALADPALASSLNPDRLAETLSDTGLALASEARVIEGDWPRTLTLWRRRLSEVSDRLHGAEEPLLHYAALVRSTRNAPHEVSGAPSALSAEYTGSPTDSGHEARDGAELSTAEDPFPFRLGRMLTRADQLKVTARAGTKLVVVTAPDGALLPEERAAISRYRLEQYMLANLYSADLIEKWGIREDPSMALLNPDDIHIVAATSDGLIAAYLCLQTASSVLAQRAAVETGRRRSPFEDALREIEKAAQATAAAADSSGSHQKQATDALALSIEDRALFPVETEYGQLFARHPGLKTLPVASVREITRLVRNQNPLARVWLRDVADIAVGETIVASSHYVREPANKVEAVIGCIAPEARQALLNYRIPVAYAPEAPIAGDNLGGGAAEGPLIWTDESSEVGRFWPFAISVLDLRRDHDYFMGLEEALNRSSTREVREAVNVLRRHTPLRAPRFAASFTYAGYSEYAEKSGYAQLALPVAWIGLEARKRPADHASGE